MLDDRVPLGRLFLENLIFVYPDLGDYRLKADVAVVPSSIVCRIMFVKYDTLRTDASDEFSINECLRCS